MAFVKNTAVTGFPFLLIKASDGSPLTLASPSCFITKDGGTQTASTNSPTEKGNGEYVVDLTAAEMNAAVIGLTFTATNGVPCHFTIKTSVQNTDVANPSVNVAAINSDTTAPANLANTYNGAGYIAATAPAQMQQVANIAATSAALNQIAASETLTTGVDTGGVSNTNTLDGTFDSWADSGGTIDGYYQFDLSGTTGAVAVGAMWSGYLVGASNSLRVFAYNWGAAGWDQIGTIQGSGSTLVLDQEFELTSAHTGTGGNLGLVRIRFQNAGLTSASLKTDRILVGYTVVSSVVTATQVENAVWNATLASHLTAGSTGAALNAAGTAGDPWSTALPGSYAVGTAGYIVGHNLDAQVSSRGTGTALTASQVENAVWDAATSSHTTTGTFGKALGTVATTDPWAAALPGSYTAGTAGYIVGHNLDAQVSSRMATFTLPTNFSLLGISGGGDILNVDNVVGGATLANQTSILNAISSITTNTSRTQIVVPQFVTSPSVGTTTIRIKVSLYNLSGQLEDADSNTVTIHASLANGTSEDSNLAATTMVRDSVGQYHIDYTVAAGFENPVYLAVTYSISAVAMAANDVFVVAQADTATTVGNIYAIVSNATYGNAALHTQIGSPMQAGTEVVLAASQPDYAPAKAGDKMDLVNAPNPTAVTAIQNGLATSVNQTTLLNRIGAWAGSGANTILGAFTALFSKGATAPSGMGTFNPATDSVEAIQDNIGTAGVNLSAILDGVIVETGITPGTELVTDSAVSPSQINARQMLALQGAVLVGVAAGGETDSITYRPTGKPSAAVRVSTTASDASGNRPMLTLRIPD